MLSMLQKEREELGILVGMPNVGNEEGHDTHMKHFVTRGRSGGAMKVPKIGPLPPYPPIS